MALMPGKNEVKVTGTAIREVNGKDVVKVFVVDADGDDHHVSIYITPKTAETGMLKASLALIGFSLEKGNHLEDLEKDPCPFAGNTVPVMLGEYQGRPKVELMLNAAPSPEKLKKLEAMMGGGPASLGEDELPFAPIAF